MDRPATNAEIFEFFKKRWVFDKLTGFTEPAFVKPREVSDYFLAHKPGSLCGEAWMAFLLGPYRQMNWSLLLERQFMNMQYTSHRISKFAVERLADSPEFLNILIGQSEEVDISTGRTDVYQINHLCGWRD